MKKEEEYAVMVLGMLNGLWGVDASETFAAMSDEQLATFRIEATEYLTKDYDPESWIEEGTEKLSDTDNEKFITLVNAIRVLGSKREQALRKTKTLL